jgi:hypothetical protein
LAQAERQKVLQQYPAVAYFDKLAPAAGIPEPKLPDGTPDYKQMEVIGAKLAVHEAEKAQALAQLSNIEDVVHGNTSFSKTKQGEIVDQNYVADLRKKATSPFKLDAGTTAVAPVKTSGAVSNSGEEGAYNPAPGQTNLVEPKMTPSAPAAAPMIEPGGIAPAGARVGMGTSLGPAATVPKAPTEAQQRAELALSRFATSGDILNSLKQSGYNPTSIGSWMNSLLPEILKSGDRKQYEAAVNLWSQGLLRLESGAAISRPEKAWYEKAFFPQVNDPESVLNAKEAARHDVERMVAEIAQQGGVVSPESKDQAQKVYERVNAFVSGSAGQPNAAPTGAAAPVRVNSPAEAEKLAPGTVFVTPDGQQRVRQ